MPRITPLDSLGPPRLAWITAPPRIALSAVVTRDDFAVHSVREGPVHRLTPFGELDISTAPILEREFHAVQPDPAVEMIVVDLTQLRFMDSAGINVLARLNALCERTDRLRVINGSPAAERIIDLSGMRDHLPIIAKSDDPLAPRQPNPSRPA